MNIIKRVGEWRRKKLTRKLHLEIDGKIEKFEKYYKENPPPTELNPYNKEYHDKLDKLMQEEIGSRDDFINWITGLTVAAILFLYPKVLNFDIANTQRNLSNFYALFSAEFIFFLTFISAMVFKCFLSVRFFHKKVEVKILNLMWSHHDLIKEIKNNIEKNTSIDSATELKFLKDHNDHLDLSDPIYQKKLKKRMFIKAKILDYAYASAVICFIFAILTMTFALY